MLHEELSARIGVGQELHVRLYKYFRADSCLLHPTPHGDGQARLNALDAASVVLRARPVDDQGVVSIPSFDLSWIEASGNLSHSEFGSGLFWVQSLDTPMT